MKAAALTGSRAMSIIDLPDDPRPAGLEPGAHPQQARSMSDGECAEVCVVSLDA